MQCYKTKMIKMMSYYDKNVADLVAEGNVAVLNITLESFVKASVSFLAWLNIGIPGSKICFGLQLLVMFPEYWFSKLRCELHSMQTLLSFTYGNVEVTKLFP